MLLRHSSHHAVLTAAPAAPAARFPGMHTVAAVASPRILQSHTLPPAPPSAPTCDPPLLQLLPTPSMLCARCPACTAGSAARRAAVPLCCSSAVQGEEAEERQEEELC